MYVVVVGVCGGGGGGVVITTVTSIIPPLHSPPQRDSCTYFVSFSAGDKRCCVCWSWLFSAHLAFWVRVLVDSF